MLRRSLAQIRLYSQKVDPTQAFDFIPAKSSDLPDIVDLCTRSFMYEEPHSKALGAKPETMKPLFEYIVAKSLQYPYSYRIHEKEELTQNYMCYSREQKILLDFDYFPSVTETIVSKLNRYHSLSQLIQILDESKQAFWKVADHSIHKVLRREITHVVPKHQRKGIANYLLHLGLDFDELRRQGIQGIVSEASSLANQRLLTKHGYKCVFKPEYNLQMHDGTEGIMVFFKDLRN